MNLKEKERLLHLAESAAVLAGEYLKNRREDWRIINSSSRHDIKIKADRKSEELILECLAVSNIPFFCEESGAIIAEQEKQQENEKAELIWIIDPLDGTLNYYQDMPFSCVSIALYEKNRPILGVVYDFCHSELFCGLIGSGAWLNHRPIQPSQVDKISNAILCTGFPVNTNFSTMAISRFIDEIQSFKKVRLLGSAALSLCYVACGRADAYREDDIMFWDVAAGLALIQSAGGSVKLESFTYLGAPVKLSAANSFLKIDEMGKFNKK